jgi:hypothetical protein
MDSGSRITGGGSRYTALLAHAGGVLYGIELGSVTLREFVYFVFQLNTQHTPAWATNSTGVPLLGSQAPGPPTHSSVGGPLDRGRGGTQCLETIRAGADLGNRASAEAPTRRFQD